ncbi:MAG: ABC transporter permease [Planctomycetaceae bacterium]
MYKLLLCLRYLRTRYIALASIISVMLGVATMIVVNSVMAGFSTEMKDRLHGILADVVVESRSMGGIFGPDELMAHIDKHAGEYIESMTPIVEVPGLITYELADQPYTVPVKLIGIDPKGKSMVGPLVEYLESFQPVMEDGKVVRAPLRTRDQDPNWELTEEAMQYRIKRLQDARDYLKQAGYDVGGITKQPEIQQASAEAGTDLDDLNNGFSDAAFEDEPFGDESEPVDLDAPQDARVYVGSGLISVPVQNPKTGKTEIRYMLRPGDDVVLGTVGAKQTEAVRIKATITDVFKSGMSEYDSSLVFMNIRELQRHRMMFKDPVYDDNGKLIDAGAFAITSIQIRLKDYDDHNEVVKRLTAAFPPEQVQIQTWEDKQGALLEAVEVEAAILNVLLFLIIAVAGFGILAIFYMIVVEKTRDIGILKALGASSRGVMSIFVSYGLALGVVGSSVGVVLGLLFVRYINEIEDALSWVTGRPVFDDKIYYFSEIPTVVNAGTVLWVAVGAIFIAVVASILPARRASGLCPVESLRYE